MAARRITGVHLTFDDAAFIAAALRQLIKTLGAQYQRPVARVFELERDLTSSVRSSGSGTSELDGIGAVPQCISGDLLGTTEAAQLLGCSAENVRGLCRRGTLPPHGRQADG